MALFSVIIMRTAVAAAALAGSALAAVRDPCLKGFGNSTFKLDGLQNQFFYKVLDSANNPGSRNYTYFFNVCKNVDLSMLPGNLPTTCNTTYSGGNTKLFPLTGPSPAFQVANIPVPAADACHRLGGNPLQTTMSYALYDPADPSAGIAVQYTGGDRCNRVGGTRSLKLWIQCDPSVTDVPDDELVEETGTCAYEIFLRSAYGCPLECPISTLQDGTSALCSNHGICGFDSTVGSPRCFCNDGYEGTDCSSATPPPPSGLSSAGAVLVGVSVFLVMTLAFLVYLWLRIRSLRLDPAAYSALRGGPELDHADTAVQ